MDNTTISPLFTIIFVANIPKLLVLNFCLPVIALVFPFAVVLPLEATAEGLLFLAGDFLAFPVVVRLEVFLVPAI